MENVMGIWQSMADDIAALPLPKRFSVVELGSQQLCYGERGPASALYKALGCGRYEAIDGNGQGTILHDLNLPLPNIGTFDLVTDFGTGEHIFDQAQVWRTVHALAKVGGYIGVIRPEQGYPAHCYYRTDECLFRDIAAANGYQIVKLERIHATRGSNILVFYRKTRGDGFWIPQQGRYHKDLRQMTEGT
jgi:hypothetical protein